MMLLVVWTNDAVIDNQRTIVVCRQVAPYNEDALKQRSTEISKHHKVLSQHLLYNENVS